MSITPNIETVKRCTGFNLSVTTDEMNILKAALGKISQNHAKEAGSPVELITLYNKMETALAGEGIQRLVL